MTYNPSTAEIESIEKLDSGKVKQFTDIPGLTGKGNLSEKALFSAIDPKLLREVGLGFRKGSIKHGLNNFRKMDLTAAQGVWDSLNRHVNDYACGIAIDPDTGISNLALIVTNVSMLYRLTHLYSNKDVIESISCGDISEIKA